MRELDIRPCDGCETCEKTRACHISDDMTLLYEEFKKADAIVLASPVYFGSISGSLKDMMDRTLCLYYGKQLKHKVGAAMATMGSDGGDLALQAIDKYYQYHEMIYAGGVFGIGGRRKGIIREDEAALEDASDLGRRIAELCSITGCSHPSSTDQ